MQNNMERKKYVMIRNGKEQNPYLIAYFNKNNIAIGQEWKSWEYMAWIDNKHTEFRRLHNMPEHITLSDEQVKVFCEYINK